MKIAHAVKKKNGDFIFKDKVESMSNPLVLVFGNRFMLEDDTIFEQIRQLFPTGHIVFGTTSGEIIDDMVLDGTIVLTAIEFQKSTFQIKRGNVSKYGHDDALLGEELMGALPREGLRHVFVISEGSTVNGSALIHGFEKHKRKEVGLSGGLCGDDDRFEKTLASYNENPKQGEVIAIGFYGDTLEITSSNYCGWTPFGPERVITKSKENVLYELDGKPALDLYKNYLGEKANELPKSALLYPLSVKIKNNEQPIVRTILNIDESKNTMTLAGDVPEGSKVQLMMSSVDDIVNGANLASNSAMKVRTNIPELALLVSCIGRKLVMDQRTEEELEEVKAVIGENVAMAGFYSYGEMAPFENNDSCKLHNQTMTLTLFSE